MKKNIIAIAFLWFISVFMHAEDMYKKIFGKYIDKDYVCYDFVIHNPTFYAAEYYYPKGKELKNKVILCKDSSYWINDAGYKLWSDSEIPYTSYTYYHFDAYGHIYRVDRLGIDKNDLIYNKWTCFYTLTENQYIETFIDEIKKKEEKTVYDIIMSDESLSLYRKDYDYAYQYEYKPGIITYSEFRNDVLERQTICEYKDNSFISSMVWYTGNQGELSQKIEYENGQRIKESRPLPDGEAVYIYDIDSKLCKYKETRNGKTRDGSCYREEFTYSTLGYISSKRETPAETVDGNYTVIDYILLYKNDEIWKKYFADVQKK